MLPRAFAIFGMLALEGTVAAQQFTVTSLHPPGAIYSRVYAVFGDYAAGEVLTTRTHPALWDSTGSWTSLAPSPQGVGEVFGVWEDRQVGRYSDPTQNTNGAMLWEGSASTAITLHPFGAWFSNALAIRGDQQVGWASFPGTPHRAALWHGSAASYVNLHPAGAQDSEALATDGVRQGGYADAHAVIWSGSAASMVDMHPPGAIGSRIHAMAPGQQAGQVVIQGLGTCAAIWNDGVAGWTNLTPQGGAAIVHGTTGLTQVGYRNGEAALWFGTPESYINLGALLPGYGETGATSVWQDENQIIVGGYGYTSTGIEAIIWRATIPAPGAAPLLALASVVGARRPRR